MALRITLLILAALMVNTQGRSFRCDGGYVAFDAHGFPSSSETPDGEKHRCVEIIENKDTI